MSFTNGIGSGQQSFSLLATASTNTTTQADAVKQKSTNSVAATDDPRDGATLTSASGLLAQAVAGSDTNVDKVAALQQAIAAGTYNVSSSAVADKLIESLLR